MKKLLLRLELIICILAVSSIVNAGRPIQFEPLSVSLPSFNLLPTERVVAYQCEVPNGGILQVKMFYLWHAEVDNGTAGVGKLTAIAIEGEDALMNDDLGFFREFVVIGKPKKPSPIDEPLDVNVELSITSDPEMQKRRTLRFTMRQLIIKPMR